VKKNRTKIILIIAFIALSIYFLVPTYKDYNYTNTLKTKKGQDSLEYLTKNEASIRDARSKRLKLGLDLQGGMRVVLEVNVLSMLQKIAKNVDDNFRNTFNEVVQDSKILDEPVVDILRRKFELKGLRLSRYFSSDIREENSNVIRRLSDEAEKSVDRAMEIIRNRVDKYGVSEAGIQKQGSRRLIVELPGVSNEREVTDLIQSTALLEFRMLKDPNRVFKVTENIDKVLLGKPIEDTTKTSADSLSDSTKTKKDSSQVDSTLMTEEQKYEKFKNEHPFQSLWATIDQNTGDIIVPDNNRTKISSILTRPDVRKVIPDDIDFIFSAKPHKAEGRDFYVMLAVSREPELTGSVITDARSQPDPQMTGGAIVTMKMNSEGAREWARITGANINKRCAIVLDNVAFSYPVIRSKIIGGDSQIEGMANMEEARLLEIVLKAGALPAPVDPIETRTVGPSLGEDSIQKGLMSGFLAIILVVVFMIVYYKTGGFMADLAVLINTLFIIGVLAGFGATLTLPGIAGIILTLGMAVDANVLIYERIREEKATGKTLRASIDNGYSKAFSAILDSNVTTILTGIVLYNFGTGPIQGFALTLMIGLAASLFTAIIVTRVIFDIMTARGMNVDFG
jgi:preprotein translocase subunit SecD